MRRLKSHDHFSSNSDLYYFFSRILVLIIIFFSSSIHLYTTYGAGDVTNRLREDGFGAQFQTIIYTAIYADSRNLNFVYTPFKTMEHNYDADPDYLDKKEQLINFKDNFPIASEGSNVKTIHSDFAIKFFEKNLQRNAKSKALQKIKQIFRANKPNNFFKNDKFNIAVHIRRPNSHDNRLAGANVPDEKFLEIITLLKQKYADRDYLIHIYSQGTTEDFQIYQTEKVILHLNESVEESFTGMVLADVLATSPSSLSYTAGLLSEGEVYYIKGFWHPPLEGWKVV